MARKRVVDKPTPDMVWGSEKAMEHPVAEEARLRDIDALAREFERDREALEAEMARYDDESLSPREREEMGLAPKKKVKK